MKLFTLVSGVVSNFYTRIEWSSSFLVSNFYTRFECSSSFSEDGWDFTDVSKYPNKQPPDIWLDVSGNTTDPCWVDNEGCKAPYAKLG
jgi:hypothetical protein